MNFAPAEVATPIRVPSTANLMLDSFDRDSVALTPWSYQITRQNSILNGFFTRIGATEVVLEWNNANISSQMGNDSLSVLVGATPYTVPFSPGFYTTAAVLDQIVASLNTQTATTNFSVTTVGGVTGINNSATAWTVVAGRLQAQLGLGTVSTTFKPINRPDLRPWRYLDFTSAQLTYNQELKDSSTNAIVRDVLCRWYFAWDESTNVDKYGYAILMGYTPFTARRIFNPPKQIRWDTKQPIGNLAFQVFGMNDANPTGILLSSVYPTATNNLNTNWLMTLQISEI